MSRDSVLPSGIVTLPGSVPGSLQADIEPDRTAWYVLRVKPKHESSVTEAIAAKGYETFLPRYLSRRRYGNRYKDFRLPLFAGYTFARFDANQRMPILTTNAVLYAVGNGRDLLPVYLVEIEALRRAVSSKLSVTPHPFLSTGDRVRIEEGPLSGTEGILLSVRGQNHLIVSVTLLQRSLSIQIERAWVRPLSR